MTTPDNFLNNNPFPSDPLAPYYLKGRERAATFVFTEDRAFFTDALRYDGVVTLSRYNEHIVKLRQHCLDLLRAEAPTDITPNERHDFNVGLTDVINAFLATTEW